MSDTTMPMAMSASYRESLAAYFDTNNGVGKYHALVAGLVVVAVILFVLIILAFFYPRDSISFNSVNITGGALANQVMTTGTGTSYLNGPQTIVLFDPATYCGKNITYVSSGTSPAPGTFTVRSKDNYNYSFQTIVTGLGTGTLWAFLVVNGVAAPFYGLKAFTESVDLNTYVSISGNAYLLANQTVQVILVTTNGLGTIDNTAGATRFSLIQQ